MSSDSRGNESDVGLVVLKVGFRHPKAERKADGKDRTKEEPVEICERACSWDT